MGRCLSRIAISAGLAAALSLPAGATTSEWKIDPQHSSAQFSVRHMTISTVRGAFSKVNGTMVLDDKDITKSTVDVTIDVSTVDTREPARDNDLRSDKFFDVAHFPTMTFKSKKVEQVTPGKLKVTGDLTIRGTTYPVLLPTVREEIETILALNPQSARGRALAGNVLMEVPGFAGGDRARAEKQFRWGIEADPHFTALRVDLARLLIAGGREDEARQELTRVVEERTPTNVADWTVKDRPRARELLESLRAKK